MKECASPEGDGQCPVEDTGNTEQDQCASAQRVVTPAPAASATAEDTLPDAIAPSLPATPDYARRNTSWCHAIEVGCVVCGA
jgi:hypothetical protein